MQCLNAVSKTTEWSVCFQGKPFNITVIQVYAPTSNAEEAEVEWFYEELLELTPKKDVLFIIGDWNAKVGSQETPRLTSKFGLGMQNESGQRLIEFCQENALVIANTLSNNIRDNSTYGHHQMVNTIFSCKEYNQSDFGTDHLVMSMCRVISWVVGKECLLWQMCSFNIV